MIIDDILSILTELSVPAQVGDYQTTGNYPSVYAVILPLYDTFEAADNLPDVELQTASVELYSAGDWREKAKAIKDKALLSGLTVTDSRFIMRDTDTRYFHYTISLEREYEWVPTDFEGD